MLIELIESKQTLSLFMKNSGEHLSNMMELAVDPSNSFNQPYLLQILLAITKRLKPQSPNSTNYMFNSLDDEQLGS